MRNRYIIFFLIRFVLSLLLATGILSVVGIISYRSLDEMVGTIANEAKPNERLILLKEIQYELSDAELHARTFSLTGEYESIEAFYLHVDLSQEKLADLYKRTKIVSKQRRIDTIRNLVSQRIELMKNLIELRTDTASSTANLEEIKKEVVELNNEDVDIKEKVDVKDPDKKRNIFRRIFGKKDKSEEEKYLSAIDKREIMKVADRIDEMTRLQEERKAEMIRKELEIITADVALSYDIRRLMGMIENDEQKASVKQVNIASENAHFTTIMIVVLTVLTALVLMVAGVTVYSYVKTNQRYRKVLNESRHRSEQLAKLRLEFLTNMSHEIRTPLNAIVGFSEQLEKQNLQPEQQKSVKIIRDSSDHLSILINDILDHAKMQSGMFNFEDISFKPTEVIQQAVDFFSYEALRKGIELSLVMSPEIPEYVGGDPLRLRQVLFNLISNALKFTSKGFVKLEAQWGPGEDDHNGVLAVTVKDSGIGIAPEKQKIIFEEYAQAESSTTRKYGGTGLGLTITKKLVELQGGELNLESELNKGTVFTFKIPYRLAHVPKPEDNTVFTSDSIIALRGMKILVADDENYNRLLLQQIFKKWGVSPELAIDGIDVLDKISQKQFDLILMDVRMPHLNGIDATTKIRSGFSPQHKYVPIIAVTAGVSNEEKNKCLAAGMNNFITKPFRESQLINVIAAITGLETEQQLPASAKLDAVTTKIDLTELIKLTGDDDEFLKKMIAGFIESSSATLDELGEFLRKEDYKGMELVSHRLAAPARHMGFAQMASRLKEIERLAGNKGDLRELSQLIREVQQETQQVNKQLTLKLAELA